LHPVKEDTHFHLVYFTRNPKGVEVFKRADKKAMEAMEEARAQAQQRARIKGSGNLELFAASKVKKTSGHYDSLRERYTSIAQSLVKERLEKDKRVRYDKAWEIAMRLPMVWESDLKDWIDVWKMAGLLAIEGLRGRARKPQRDEGHMLLWKGPQ
jgi:hypothetical protein